MGDTAGCNNEDKEGKGRQRRSNQGGRKEARRGWCSKARKKAFAEETILNASFPNPLQRLSCEEDKMLVSSVLPKASLHVSTWDSG